MAFFPELVVFLVIFLDTAGGSLITALGLSTYWTFAALIGKLMISVGILKMVDHFPER